MFYEELKAVDAVVAEDAPLLEQLDINLRLGCSDYILKVGAVCATYFGHRCKKFFQRKVKELERVAEHDVRPHLI